jgi:hypothetical protein
MTRAVEIIRKVLALLPVVTSVVADVEAARASESPGGAKVTPAELAQVISRGVQRIGEAIADLLAPPAAR